MQNSIFPSLPFSKWLVIPLHVRLLPVLKVKCRKGSPVKASGVYSSAGGKVWGVWGENTLLPKMKELQCYFSLSFKFFYSIIFYNVILFYCFPLLTTDTKSFLNAGFLCVLCSILKLQIPVDNEGSLVRVRKNNAPETLLRENWSHWAEEKGNIRKEDLPLWKAFSVLWNEDFPCLDWISCFMTKECLNLHCLVTLLLFFRSESMCSCIHNSRA